MDEVGAAKSVFERGYTDGRPPELSGLSSGFLNPGLA
jgi:hypothetical protein